MCTFIQGINIFASSLCLFDAANLRFTSANGLIQVATNDQLQRFNMSIGHDIISSRQFERDIAF